MKSIITLVAILVVSASFLRAQTVTDYAGQAQKSGFNLNSVKKEQALFHTPYGIAMDSKGNIFVAEEGNHTFTVIAANGYTKIRAGAKGMASFVDATGTTARFNSPHGMVCGLNDEIYVCDYDNCVIRKVDKFTNFGSNQVVKVFSGKYSVQGSYYKASPGYADGATKTAQFDGPTDIDIDSKGNLYVADRNNHCIRKIASDGSVTTFAGIGKDAGNVDDDAAKAKFNTPTGIFVDGDDVYVADRGNSAIRKISNGKVTTVVNNTKGIFLPNDLIKMNGDLYILDQCKILKYSNGTVTTYAGSTTTNDCGYKGGSGTNAKFSEFFCIMPFKNNEFLVADKGNHVIRKVKDCSGYKPTITKSGNTLTAESGTAYQWYKDGKAISGATNKTYTPIANGNYTCEVTNSEGCSGTSNSINVTTDSIFDEVVLDKLFVYPNPATDQITIGISFSQTQNVDLRILNHIGQEVYTSNFTSISDIYENVRVSHFTNGVYFLHIQSEDFNKVVRFLKE